MTPTRSYPLLPDASVPDIADTNGPARIGQLAEPGSGTASRRNQAGRYPRVDRSTPPPGRAVLRVCTPDALPPRRQTAVLSAPSAQLHLPYLGDMPVRLPSGAPGPADAERRQLSAQLLMLSAQTALGLRPVTQAIRWTTRAVYEDLQRKHLRATAVHRSIGHQPGNFSLVGVRAQQVSDRIIECCATAVTAGRTGVTSYRAIALRVAEHEGGWWVTHIEM